MLDRRILVKLVSTALTGFFYTTSRTRLGEKLAMMKYDPKGEYQSYDPIVLCGQSRSATDWRSSLVAVKKHVLFTEAKIK